MKIKLLLIPMIALSILAFFSSPAKADGIIIPDPPPCDPCPLPPCPGPRPCPIPPPMEQLIIRYHHVNVEIKDQIAITHVDQVFYNPNDWEIEGMYVFPIPTDAAVNDFTLWVDGKPVTGELMDADQARRTYEEIVMNLKDPALLEYADRGALRARVYPIPPGGERRIELEYTQALSAENGLVRYLYPLNTEKFSREPLESVSISLDIRSNLPIRAVYSPTHQMDVSRESDYEVRVGYEEQNVLPDTDFALYYSLGENQAFHLLSYRNPGYIDDPDGFFLLLLAPGIQQAERVVGKDVLLVMDHSGSMDGEKFRQAQDALRYVLNHLNPEDRFNIITFSTGVESYAQGLRPAIEFKEALPWVDRMRAEGSTDINRALLEAVSIAEIERPTYLIFLTDGLPTEGVTDSQQILDNFAEVAPENMSLFAFGVGYDVDTFLLDSLAHGHHGSTTYVLPSERLDESLSTFYAKISAPVLTDLEIDFGDLPVYDIYPDPLPDLFLGSQIIVVGRYHQGGITDLTLMGSVDGKRQIIEYPEQVLDEDTVDPGSAISVLPRLWATRKIGYLLNQIRLNGAEQEMIDQIVRLSIRYGIITPYTSYLVTESNPLGVEEQQRIAVDQFNLFQAQAVAPPSGQEAVEKAARQESLAGAQAVEAPPVEAIHTVRLLGGRTFVNQAGYWTDTAFDPEQIQTIKVAFLSDDYFSLAKSRPDLAAAFALGQAVIAISGGVAYEVVPADTPVEPVNIPTPVSTESGQVHPTSVPQLPAMPKTTPSSKPSSAIPCLGGFIPPVAFLVLHRALKRRRTVIENYL